MGKKQMWVLLVLAALLVTLTACGPKRAQDVVSKALDLDVSSGSEISNYDTHSGNGDGTSCIVLRFDEDGVLKQIEGNSQWNAFPLDETVQTLVYGVSDETGRMGPLLTDKDGNALVPEIRNGYYRLIDRQEKTSTGILDRGAYNFTLGLYDTDTDTLYCCQLDT